MFKPIIIEMFVVAVASVSYLAEKAHGPAAAGMAESAMHMVSAGSSSSAQTDSEIVSRHAGRRAADAGSPAYNGLPSSVAMAGTDAPPSGGGFSAGFLKTTGPVRQTVTDTIAIAGRLSLDEQHADRLRLVAYADESEVLALQLGQELNFRAASLPGQSFTGQLSFISPDIDAATHTVQIICDVPNLGRLLRPEMFVKGLLKTGESSAWVVPKSAVIHVGDTDYVVIRDDDRHYRRLAVTGHILEPDRYAITGGLARAVPVVSDAGLLLNELVGEG